MVLHFFEVILHLFVATLYLCGHFVSLSFDSAFLAHLVLCVFVLFCISLCSFCLRLVDLFVFVVILNEGFGVFYSCFTLFCVNFIALVSLVSLSL